MWPFKRKPKPKWHPTGQWRWNEIGRTDEYILQRKQNEFVDFATGAKQWADEWRTVRPRIVRREERVLPVSEVDR